MPRGVFSEFRQADCVIGYRSCRMVWVKIGMTKRAEKQALTRDVFIEARWVKRWSMAWHESDVDVGDDGDVDADAD